MLELIHGLGNDFGTTILVVTHQRASKIADTPGFPAPVGREGQSRQWDRRGTCGAAPGLRYGGPELGRLLRVPDL